MRRYRFDSNEERPLNVVILARISNIYADLRYEFFLNPWELYASDSLSLNGDCIFEASFHVDCNVNPMVRQRSSLPLQETTHTDKIPNLVPLNVGSTIMALPEPGYFMKHSYAPLQEGSIRLLHLLPGAKEEPLRGIISTVSFESAGRYRALSYVWGTVTQSERLWTSTGIVRITPNLKAALQRLRRKEETLVLWVDAICINQDDKGEKGHQIRLLPQIFQHATSMFAFLKGNERMESTIATLMQIRAKGAVKDWPKFLPPVPASWKDKPVPSQEDPVWDEIRDFFQNSWFRRAWIVQEVVLAASVRIVCGKWIVDWNDLLSAAETIDREYRNAVSDSLLAILPWEYFLELAQHREWEARQTRWALINLLESFRYLESTLPRDRLFALVGFASDGANPAFEPDYKCEFDVLVKRYAGAFIEQGKVLQLLYRAGFDSQSPNLPSWLPDWTIIKPSSLYESSTRGRRFSASWVAEPKFKYIPGSDELQVYGHSMDLVQRVSCASNIPAQWYEYMCEVDLMIDELGKNINPWPSPQNIRDMKWQVPVAGALYPKIITSSNTDLLSSYKSLRQQLHRANRERIANEEVGVKAWGEGSNYALALQENLSGWRFFVTHRKYVGIGPSTTQVGDCVFILNGGGVPFLLRPEDESKGAYRFVGECYVHGLMNGEGAGLWKFEEGFLRLR
jgi:Heterokaryon incompatibility protein (HET)